MKNNKMYGIAAAFACMLMSCGTGRNSVAFVDFSGEWDIVEVNGKKVSTADVPFLGFDKEGHRLYGSAGCNRLMGSFDVDTLHIGKMKFDQVAATRMMCQDMTLEQHVMEALNKVAGYETVGENVALNDVTGHSVMLLKKRDIAEATVEELNGAWEIVTVKGHSVGQTEKQPQLIFDLNGNKVYGNTGCNTINGSFTQENGQGASLRFGQMISTMMACPNMEVESDILNALNEVRSFIEKEEGMMALLGEDGTELLILKKLHEVGTED